MAHLEAALQLRPGYAEAHNNLGVVLASIPGREAEALAHFQAAVKTKPDYADAHVNLGIALSAIPGRTQAAIAELQTALQIKPDPQVRQMLDQLLRQ
jgi:tetratricopeptide (TPR) repeat protein